MTKNARLAADALGRLEGLGVKHFIACAGARNAPLVTSLLAGGEASGFQVWHHFDERAAAFFALGLAKRKGEPVAVLTTSGTAVAECLPAAVEAYYSGIPLVLVTADRPERFRGSGAPQAIEQVGIFGPYAATETADWKRDEPLHLNPCFEEPSADDRADSWEKAEIPALDPCRAGSAPATVARFVESAERLVVLLGEIDDPFRPDIETFLAKLGAPVWAEATSGLRESLALEVIDEAQVSHFEPSHILRIGGVPSLRFWRDLEILSDVKVLSVTKRPFTGLARESEMVRLNQQGGARQGWASDLTLSGMRQAAERSETGGAKGRAKRPMRPPYSETPEREAIEELSKRIPSEALVYLGNSLPIREWNAAATFDIPHPRCFASRGANGIDGQIATFFGLSEGEAESWAILGDLTALYDMNAPALLDQQSPGRRCIVILNNGGGRIFSRLPSMAGLSESEKLVTENRHAVRFEHWAAMWGMAYSTWVPGDRFPDLPDGNGVLEVLIPSE